MIPMVFLALGALAAPVLAQDEPLYVCDGTKHPNWHHCDQVLDDMGWRDAIPGVDVVNNNDTGSCGEYCRTWTPSDNSKNCELSICFYTDTCIEAAKPDFVAVYDNIIKQYCKPQSAGGVYTTENIEYFAWLNPNYAGPIDEKRDASQGDPDELTLSLGEFEERFNTSALHERVKRDDKWRTISLSRSVGKSGESRQVTDMLAAGQTDTWSFSETETVSISTSVEMGAGWDIFTASMGVTTESSFSTTIESGKSFTAGNCPRGGIVWFIPLWTNYYGYWESDEDTHIDIWIPEVDNEGYSAGRFQTECTG